ncbi:MAG: LamG-like jellyroll fold domain-containing protein [Caldilineaceae bacterium]
MTTDTKFSVNWDGSDARAGLRWYHVQVRDGNRSDSQWSDWLVNTTKSGELFAGQTGHTYYFRVRAMDQVGHWEEWPTGDGDTYTVVNPAAAPPTAWWNNAYAYKRNLIIRNNDGDAMPAHYPIRLHFDDTTNPTAAELYSGSLAPTKGDDLRIVYNNQTEIDRFVQRFTPSAIDLWFPLQADLGGSESNNGGYQLYYGNAGAGSPPSTINTIFLPEADNNTLGLWHFQEGSGGTVYDSSGRSHHGALSNGSWVDGYLGNAVSFNGSDTTLSLGNHSDFNNGGAITLEAWIYPTRRSWGMVFMKGIDGHGHYRLNLTGDGTVEFVITTQDGERSMLGSTSLQANQWYHVAGVHDGGNDMWIYVNGVQEREKTDVTPFSGRDYPLYIGNAPWWNGMAFTGLIQHARISNVARRDFPYARINVPPSVAAGSPIAPPVPGTPDLTVLGLNAYPTPESGIIVEALVQNQGNRETQNGFYTDLYLDHIPTGAGDYTGSVQFWVNSPIAAGATITLTTVLTDLTSNAIVAAQSQAPGAEVTHTLYMQTDSAGVVPDADKTNNILSSGIEVCLATPDAFEDDNEVTQARTLAVAQAQSHNFSSAGDQDWVKFSAEAGTEYTFSTRNLGPAADTYWYLYNPDGATLLTAKDDGNDTLASQIHWVAPASATYYLLVRHWNPNVAGCGSGYELVVEVTQTAPPTPTFTPTPTTDGQLPITATPTPTPTSTEGLPPVAINHAIYLPSIQQNSKGASGGTSTPTPATTPAAVLLSNALIETCKWAIQMGLTGFTPNSPITVSSAYSEVTCPQGQQHSASWSQVYPATTDGNGALIVAYLHQGTGSYTYTFTDATGKSATLSFNSQIADTTATPVPTPLPSATPTFTPSPTQPPSQLLAYAVNQNGNVDIYQMRSDGSAQKNLTNHPAFEWGPSWSPDGEQIAFVSERDGNLEIYVMNADGSAQRRVTQNTLYDIGPVWSPDGQWLAYKSFENSDYHIYLLKPDGSGQQLLTTGANSDWRMSWSPDSTRLAFSSFRDGNGEIYLINIDGTGLARITDEPTEDNDATWSPDGGKLAFVSRRDGNQEIYVFNLDGSQLTRLTNHPAADSIPIWSPDGQTLAFTSNRDGFDAVYLMNADGSAQTRITNGPHGSNFAVWRPK